MKDTLLIGMALGFIAGAVLVTRSDKAKQLVSETADCVENQIEKGKKMAEKQLEKGKKAVKKQVEKLK